MTNNKTNNTKMSTSGYGRRGSLIPLEYNMSKITTWMLKISKKNNINIETLINALEIFVAFHKIYKPASIEESQLIGCICLDISYKLIADETEFKIKDWLYILGIPSNNVKSRRQLTADYKKLEKQILSSFDYDMSPFIQEKIPDVFFNLTTDMKFDYISGVLETFGIKITDNFKEYIREQVSSLENQISPKKVESFQKRRSSMPNVSDISSPVKKLKNIESKPQATIVDRYGNKYEYDEKTDQFILSKFQPNYAYDIE